MKSLPFAFVLVAAACSSSSPPTGVQSADQAKQAYLGLDLSIDKAITLGFTGFNTASSANIAPQTANGNRIGTMTVAGQVDQGASANKTMRLTEELKKYSDDGAITYDTTAGALPALALDLKGIPNGTLNGSLSGAYTMTGALAGTVTLSLTFSGALEPVAGKPGEVERKPGTTHITGTATSGGATFNVDITR